MYGFVKKKKRVGLIVEKFLSAFPDAYSEAVS